MKTCAIILNGNYIPQKIEESFIICADKGYELAKKFEVNVIIGDFDSLKKIPKNIKSLSYPSKKDKTDGELCVDYAKENGFEEIVFYGALGGRIDHQLANFNLLAYAEVLGLNGKIADKNCFAYYFKKSRILNVRLNSVVSLIPKTDVYSLSISGVAYPLNNAFLPKNSSLCISNIAISTDVNVQFESGELFFIENHHG